MAICPGLPFGTRYHIGYKAREAQEHSWNETREGR